MDGRRTGGCSDVPVSDSGDCRERDCAVSLVRSGRILGIFLLGLVIAAVVSLIGLAEDFDVGAKSGKPASNSASSSSAVQF